MSISAKITLRTVVARHECFGERQGKMMLSDETLTGLHMTGNTTFCG